MTRSEVDYGDVQGIVRFGYKKMSEASYALLRVRDPAAARSWLRSAKISSAADMAPPPATALQVAFTAGGLQALGLPSTVLAGFSAEFLTGMTEESRSRRLGDVGNNAPALWEWGAGAALPHVVAMFFAEPGRLDAHVQGATGQSWRDAFDVIRWLDTGDLKGLEPFGFMDGISQPQLDWQQERDGAAGQLSYTNVAALGEFLLGYRNEYGKYSERPLLDAEGAAAALPTAEDLPEKRDLGRNGTYLVLRQLRQDVRGFWQFIAKQSGSDQLAADKLAAAMVGRTRAGEPLVPLESAAIPGIGSDPVQVRQNQFTFDQDPAGARCPFGAHIRRSNPRNADYPGSPGVVGRLLAAIGFAAPAIRDDLTSSVRFHRLLRRGREYGPGVSPAEALAPAPANDPERGLRFVCLNASILRQFEFVQNAWIANTKFNGMSGESDPLMGGREAVAGCPVTGDFLVPADDGVARRVSGVPQFVTVRGGAYFFLPGLRALAYIAAK